MLAFQSLYWINVIPQYCTARHEKLFDPISFDNE